MNKIQDIVLKKDWNFLISNYRVKEVCSSLNFREAMYVAKHLCYDNIQDDEKQQYALKLASEIKEHFKQEWENDWQNDVFLGYLYEMLCLYDERYLCYKRAYDSLKDPPEELLLLLSKCNRASGTPPITDKESEFYLRKALEKNLNCEVAFAMTDFYKLKENKAQEDYWDQIAKKLQKENMHPNQIILDVLKS